MMRVSSPWVNDQEFRPDSSAWHRFVFVYCRPQRLAAACNSLEELKKTFVKLEEHLDTLTFAGFTYLTEEDLNHDEPERFDLTLESVVDFLSFNDVIEDLREQILNYKMIENAYKTMAVGINYE